MCGSDDLSFIRYYAASWDRFSEDGSRIAGSCYGKKIFGKQPGKESSWERIKCLLLDDRASRRAIVSLVDEAYATTPKDAACISTIQFLIRDNRLHCITTMRSNDVIWGLCYDIFVVTMLQERLAAELEIELGWYQHSVGSMHIYAEHLELGEQILAEGIAGQPTAMPHMCDLHALPRFLHFEERLRLGQIEAISGADQQTKYWRDLSVPLIALAQRKHGTVSRRSSILIE